MSSGNKKLQLEQKRHTLAHLLAAAVLIEYPHALITLGPAIDTGFYYDIDFSAGSSPGDEDLKKIQKQMRKMLGQWTSFEHKDVTADEARELFKGNQFKIEMIDDIENNGETITLYTVGAGTKTEFTDLCRGGHTENPAEEITSDSFKLHKIAGAYWRGDEKNPMLTRIYGLAFDTKEDLQTYETQLEEAKKRDHRKLGKELGLFSFSELVGPGLPLWSPKGTILRTEIDKFVTELRAEKGYQMVTIPHIAKKALYEKSGHWQKYSEDLFKVHAKEGSGGDEYVLKPMNCPCHTQIFDAVPRSYKEMPQRFAETTMVYRAEQSGELSGLTRVLSITQDDAHVFCRESQLKEEIEAIWDIVDTFYGKFGFDLKVRLSFRDPENKEKYLGTDEVWEESQQLLTDISKERGSDYFIEEGEASFYAPKLDFIANDSIGRAHQVATIQLDRMLPDRFDLSCTNEQGEKERVIMIHAAIAGSLERFIAVLIEHLSGNFPLRFAPVQLAIIPVSDVHNQYAKEVHAILQNAEFRVDLYDENESMGKKIRTAKKGKLPYFIVIGDKEVSSNTITLESRDTDKTEIMSTDDLLVKLKTEL